MFIVVAYDIPDDKLRTRVYKALFKFGEPVQLSVFECIINDQQFSEMRKILVEILEGSEGDIRFYDICEACHRRLITIGRAVATSIKPVYII